MKHPSAGLAITKARRLVHAVRKSAMANEEMTKRCGKTLMRLMARYSAARRLRARVSHAALHSLRRSRGNVPGARRNAVRFKGSRGGSR
ncbi:hypothetical protein AAFF_G00279500 [Aldrovandia affinis]|uniref:Uncharacterized protein n=1 Tax=Aldrovandia affinis TaxID=143900 RepID=A0AAD7ST97_9TELE|nr:hypothetical protein AAFF_G00279500 [Aldrovandia affinis]